MILLTFIFLMINILLPFLAKIFNLELDRSVLNCGIFGCSLKQNANRKSALNKVKILGLYNIKRGKDASGIFINGEIIKGIGVISEFDDFIKNKVLSVPKENALILGHTRQGSPGYKKTIDEAHPFLIDEDMVFTHNGKIQNIFSLCNKYELDEKEFSVDSQALGTILHRNGNKVLEEYTGAAALAYTKLSEPNILYIYHGKSKDWKNGPVNEERPLYFMETTDGIYYSSIEDSLLAIRDSEEEKPFCLKYNTIVKIHNGKFLFDDFIKIDREETNVTEYTHVKDNRPKDTGTHSRNFTTDYTNTSTKYCSESAIVSENLINRESLPIKFLEAKEKKGFIYYHLNRYWEAPRTLLHGPIYLKKGGVIGNFDDKSSELTFFWNGIILHGKGSYMELKQLSEEKNPIVRNWVLYPNEHNYALHMSKHSPWPVTNIGKEASVISNFYKNQWYSNGESCKKANFTPKYSNGRNYKTENGFLVTISPSQREKTLLDSAEIVQNCIKTLTDSSKLVGIPGGSSKPFFQFLLPEKITSEKQEKEIQLWYDVPFETYEKGMDNIGDSEMQSLRDFVRIVWKQDFNLLPLENEISDAVNSILNKSTVTKCSILDSIDDFGEKQLLINCYDNIISIDNKKHNKQFEINFEKDNSDDEETNRFYTEDVEEAMDEDEIQELAYEGINELENIQMISMDLMNAQNSDFAQEYARVLIVGADNMLNNLQNVVSDYKKPEFLQRIKKIRETKNMKDGVL